LILFGELMIVMILQAFFVKPQLLGRGKRFCGGIRRKVLGAIGGVGDINSYTAAEYKKERNAEKN
jgi:hypothetical protein